MYRPTECSAGILSLLLLFAGMASADGPAYPILRSRLLGRARGGPRGSSPAFRPGSEFED